MERAAQPMVKHLAGDAPRIAVLQAEPCARNEDNARRGGPNTADKSAGLGTRRSLDRLWHICGQAILSSDRWLYQGLGLKLFAPELAKRCDREVARSAQAYFCMGNAE